MGTLYRRLLTATAGLAFIITTVFQQVESTGTFELRLVNFSNRDGRDSTGGCCRPNLGPADGPRPCSRPCAVSFRVCVKNYQAFVDHLSPCIIGEHTTGVIGDHDDSYLVPLQDQKPIVLNFNFTWPGSFSLVIEAYHKSDMTGSSRSLVSRFIAQRYLSAGTEWTSDRLTTNGSSLDVLYRVHCEAYYFGAACATLCRPRNDTFGHYMCRPGDGAMVCLPGWTGEYCIVPICLIGCHSEHGQCSQPQECKCRPGWEGELCDMCTLYPGCIHGTCKESWQCNCNEGWGGLFCDQDLNYCTNHRPCKNGGTCTNTGQGSYTCCCAEQYMGKTCDQLRNPCQNNPCQNGGICTNPSEGKSNCSCALGFYGEHCETSANICTDNPCENGGSCVHDPGGFACACLSGFSGSRCEKSINNCKPGLCLNGGTCVELQEGPHCRCPAGFLGAHCEDVSSCINHPCQNGGTCYELSASFQCTCAAGFSGSVCQVNVDECSSKPCKNGGMCHDRVNDYDCECKPGFSDKNCSMHKDLCNSSPCLNGGWCQSKADGFSCHCPKGYSGVLCEIGIVERDLNKNSAPHQDRANHPTAITNATLTKSEESAALSGGQVALIATLSTTVPCLALILCAILLAVRRSRRRREPMPKHCEDFDDDELKQNERNALYMNMNNKSAMPQKIVNTLDRPPTKVTNEGSAKVLNTDVSSKKLQEKNLVCLQRTLDRRESNGGLGNGCPQSSTRDWSASSSGGVYIIEDHFKSHPPSHNIAEDHFQSRPPSLNLGVEDDSVLATEV